MRRQWLERRRSVRGRCSFEGSPDHGIRREARVTLLICDSDGSLGSSSPFPNDFILISVDTGPYEGYTNAGTPSGNITVRR